MTLRIRIDFEIQPRSGLSSGNVADSQLSTINSQPFPFYFPGFKYLSKNTSTKGRRSFCFGCRLKLCGASGMIST
ncbi:hypothetical protein CfE428DRAFT_2320 [Chthoniobacter flavus Ellin428]|uniref:Uncharacterized protein n=1 Tax=Chthoniobacter flavus Ellin428 TaxID=497964 RepID=B4D082_9BACT|nr:hypothetical protein CfE428DRAFT_2320 [Chthoniobacter flavus Ellin428]